MSTETTTRTISRHDVTVAVVRWAAVLKLAGWQAQRRMIGPRDLQR